MTRDLFAVVNLLVNPVTRSKTEFNPKYQTWPNGVVNRKAYWLMSFSRHCSDTAGWETGRTSGCASGCVVECRICNREVAGSNLSLGYFAPRSTLPSIPPGSVNEYQLRLGRQRQVWLIPIADKRVGVQVKL